MFSDVTTKGEYLPDECRWGCCNCGIHGAMDCISTIHCPGCNHLRCVYCNVETVGRSVPRTNSYRYGTTPYLDQSSSKNKSSKGRTSKAYSSENKPSGSKPPENKPPEDKPPENKRPKNKSSENKQSESKPLESQEREQSLPTLSHSFPTASSPLGSVLGIVASIAQNNVVKLHKSEGTQADTPTSSAKATPSSLSFFSPASTLYSRDGEIVTPQQNSPDNEIDLDETRSEDDNAEGGVDISYEDHAIRTLECRLMTVLDGDLDLAACLIPRIYSLTRAALQADNQEHANTVPVSQEAQQNSKAPEFSNGSSSTKRLGGKIVSSNPPSSKRLRDSEDPNEPNQGPSRGFKAPKPISGGIVRKFACHYYKRDPARYDSRNGRKYRSCSAPSVPVHRLRQIKDHFDAAHGPFQCVRCSLVFSQTKDLMDHCNSQRLCIEQPRQVKEGIDDTEWKAIVNHVKAKRGLKGTDKERHEIERWYDIWDLLFPGVQAPSNPWTDSPTQSAPQLHDFMLILAAFERFIEFDINQGTLRRDDHVHQRYLNALQEAYQVHINATRNAIDSSAPIMESLGPATSLFRTMNEGDVDSMAGIILDNDVALQGAHVWLSSSQDTENITSLPLNSPYNFAVSLAREPIEETLGEVSGFNYSLDVDSQEPTDDETYWDEQPQ